MRGCGLTALSLSTFQSRSAGIGPTETHQANPDKPTPIKPSPIKFVFVCVAWQPAANPLQYGMSSSFLSFLSKEPHGQLGKKLRRHCSINGSETARRAARSEWLKWASALCAEVPWIGREVSDKSPASWDCPGYTSGLAGGIMQCAASVHSQNTSCLLLIFLLGSCF